MERGRLHERGQLARQEEAEKLEKIEMCFSYPEAADENRFMWCCGVVQLVRQRDDKELRLDVRWDKEFIAEGESEKPEELLKKLL